MRVHCLVAPHPLHFVPAASATTALRRFDALHAAPQAQVALSGLEATAGPPPASPPGRARTRGARQ